MNQVLRILAWPVILAPAIYLAVIWQRMPAQVPIHFDIDGNIDQYAPKEMLIKIIGGITLLTAVVYALLLNIYRIDPRKTAVANKERMQRIGFVVAMFLSAVQIFIIHASYTGKLGLTVKFVLVGVAFLFAFLGNYMYNIQPNYFAGLRLPWTLESEDNWRSTHQFAGKLWFTGGLILGVVMLFLTDNIAIYIGTPIIFVLILVPVIYSYRLYKQNNTGTKTR